MIVHLLVHVLSQNVSLLLLWTGQATSTASLAIKSWETLPATCSLLRQRAWYSDCLKWQIAVHSVPCPMGISNIQDTHWLLFLARWWCFITSTSICKWTHQAVHMSACNNFRPPLYLNMWLLNAGAPRKSINQAVDDSEEFPAAIWNCPLHPHGAH